MSVPEYQAPEVDNSLDDDKKKAKKLRSALTQTEGGIAGQEVMGGEVSTRDTLFGN